MARPGIILSEVRTDCPNAANSDLLEEQPSRDCPVDLQILLDELLERLSDSEYDVILHAVAGLTDKKIAENLGIPIGTVASRKSTARLKLREMRDVG